MPVAAPVAMLPSNLADAVEQRILSCTRGRIRRLAVEAIGDHLLVQACTPSYYVKQLVIQAIVDSLGQPNSATLELDIQVMTDQPRPPEGSNTRRAMM
jgi:hypothetical protein